MKEILPSKLTMGRVRVSKRENRNDQRNATYIVVEPSGGRQILVVLADKDGWDHCEVSVYGSKKWEVNLTEITFVRDLVFKPDEVVMEFHQKPEGYINVGDSTRHLWRNQEKEVDVPPLVVL